MLYEETAFVENNKISFVRWQSKLFPEHVVLYLKVVNVSPERVNIAVQACLKFSGPE